MASPSLHSAHFFQPLLPGFHTHINIPVAFFSKHVQGRNEQNKTAKLRSDASEKTWIVKIDGLKLSQGWEDFAVAHDLRIGDITVFRHEGDMVFHVTALGPSCCEIQYTSSNNNNIGKSSRVKKNPREKEESSSDHSCFVATVSASSLSNDRLYLPLSFAKSNGLHKMNGKKILLLNEDGKSWKLNLKCSHAGKYTFVKPGFRRFCAENGMRQGQYTFKLVRKCGPPVIRLCRAKHRPDSESSPSHSCFVGSVTPSSLNNDKLYLPKEFVISNGLSKGCSEVVLKNERGERWTLVLKHYGSHGIALITSGWTRFCKVNGIEAGHSFMFKLVGTEEKPVFSWYPAGSNLDKAPLECPEDSDDGRKSQENEKESLGDKINMHGCLEMEGKNNFSRCRASSSYSQNHFVTLTLTPYAFNKYILILPMGFTRVNGINKQGKITLLGQDGGKWVVDLLQNKTSKAMRLGKGWREFCEAQGVKIGESFVLELIWEEEASPALKFRAKLNSV